MLSLNSKHVQHIRNRFRCVCFLQFDWLIFLGNYYHVGFKKGRDPPNFGSLWQINFREEDF
jgi:hypothetical protein